MFTSYFCPTCCKIADDFLQSNILNQNDKILNRTSLTFSNPQDLRQCLGCDRIFYPLGQGQYDELDITEKDIPDIEISLFSESSAWKSLSDHLHLLISKELDSTSKDRIPSSNGNNWNLVAPVRCDENAQNDPINDEFDFLKDIPVQEYKETVDFESNGASNLPETNNFEIQESSSVQPVMISEDWGVPAIITSEDTNLRVPASSCNIDLYAIVSEIFGKSEESELSQANATTFPAETLSNYQPLESTCIMAYDGVNGSTISSLYTNQSAVIDGEPENSEDVEKLYNLLDQNKPKAEGFKYDHLIHAIYSLNTNQRVSLDAIQTKIYNNFVTDENDERSLICKIGHECPKVFDSLSVVVDHLFSNFFYIYCKTCQVIFNYPSNFRRHRRSCAKTSKELRSIICNSETDCDRQMTDAIREAFQDERFVENLDLALREAVNNSTDSINDQNGTIKGKRKPIRNENNVSGNGFGAWDYPFYNRSTNEKGSVDEMEIKIAENYTYEMYNSRSYVCLVDHGCRRYFRQLKLVKKHLFSHFFYFKCENCGAKAGYYSNMDFHLKHCKEKAKIDKIISSYKRSIAEKPSSSADSESMMRSDVLSMLVSLIIED